MMRAERGLEPELEAFLNHHRIERTVPPEIRMRTLAAARSVVAAGGAVPAASSATRTPRPASVPMPVARGRARLRVALAASIAVAAAAVGAAAAIQSRRDHAPPPSARSQSLAAAAPSVPAVRVGRALPDAPMISAASAIRVKPTRPRHLVAKVDPFAAELDLLQRAHAAYTRRDFSTALTLISEHARRFPRGNLAEQREALRVRSLAGAGRGDEAHRAAAGFGLRFPRSVLLPQIEGGSESPEP